MRTRFICWRRRRWFASRLREKRRSRDSFNEAFDRGYQIGRFSMVRLYGERQLYVAVWTGKTLKRWAVVAAPANMVIGLQFMRNVDKVAATSGRFNREKGGL